VWDSHPNKVLVPVTSPPYGFIEVPSREAAAGGYTYEQEICAGITADIATHCWGCWGSSNSSRPAPATQAHGLMCTFSLEAVRTEIHPAVGCQGRGACTACLAAAPDVSGVQEKRTGNFNQCSETS